MTQGLHISKAAQVAALFLKASGGKEMPYIRLLKLMYVLERDSLKERRRPVIADHVVAMAMGPVLSGVYDLIRGSAFGDTEWSRLINTRAYNVLLQGESAFDKLSTWEIFKIHDIVARFADLDRWQLIDHLHEELPEWQSHKPDGATSKCNPIPLKDILSAVGHGKEATAIEEDIIARESLRALIGDD